MRPEFLGLLAILAGCVPTTSPAVRPDMTLRPETRPECVARCREMGMRLGAVVLIRDSAGCVCEPDSASSARGAAAVASGAALVMAEEEAAAQARRDEEERQRRQAEESERQQRESQPPPAAPGLPSP
jgi:hypothetical protein